MTTTKTPTRSAKVAKMAGQGRFDIKFFRDTYSELKKVVWPTREEATNLTMIVIIVSVAVGLFLGGFDFLFFWIVNTVMGLG